MDEDKERKSKQKCSDSEVSVNNNNFVCELCGKSKNCNDFIKFCYYDDKSKQQHHYILKCVHCRPWIKCGNCWKIIRDCHRETNPIADLCMYTGSSSLFINYCSKKCSREDDNILHIKNDTLIKESPKYYIHLPIRLYDGSEKQLRICKKENRTKNIYTN